MNKTPTTWDHRAGPRALTTIRPGPVPVAFGMDWLARFLRRPGPPGAEQRARQLIAAIDAGGLPLNAAIVNDIARALGLEVSARASMDDTIARIRAALRRL